MKWLWLVILLGGMPLSAGVVLDSDAAIEKYLTHAFFDRSLQSKIVTVRSRATSIEDLIELIGVSAGIDFIIDETVSGSVGRVNFENRPAGDILQVLSVKNRPRLAFIKQRGMWRVMTYADAVALLKKLQQEPVVRCCFTLRYARCDEAMQGHIETMWQHITQNGPHPSSYCTIENESKKVFFRGWRKHVREMNKFLAEIDRVTDRVRIDAVVAEVDSKYEKQLGVNWTALHQPNGEFSHVMLGSPEMSGMSQAAHANLQTKKSSVSLPITFGGNDINLQRLLLELHAAEMESKARILLKPSVLTNHSETAEILIGSSVPIKTLVEDVTQGKSRNVQTVQYKDVGTILNVRPTVSADRKSVQLDILVENSSVVGTDADQAPVIKTIRTRNKVTLRSGQTTAIGGLMLQREDSDGNYVPILCRLPIIGGILFGSKYRSHQKSQLIIFITPTVS